MAAARDLGAGFWRSLVTILVPLTYAGLFAGFLFVFVMVAGSSTEVQMLGGAGASIVSVMINDVMRVANYPLAFAISVVMLATIFGMVLDRKCFLQALGPLRGGRGMTVNEGTINRLFLWTLAVLALMVIYAPSLYLVAISFNASLQPAFPACRI